MNASPNLEDEVWSQEVAYLEYLQAADLEGYLSLLHEDFMGWPNDSPAPLNKNSARRVLAESLATNQFKSLAFEIKPISVRIFDNVGIILGEVIVRAITNNPMEILSLERFTHSWLRTESGWKIIGGMSAPLAISE